MIGGDGIEVDVAVLGAGAQGLYLARCLAEEYRICVISDPGIAMATTGGNGLISAGYEGDDPARMQPARRAAGYWKLWGEANGVLAGDPPCVVVPPAERSRRLRLWDDASLTHSPAAVPGLLDGGVLADGDAHLAEQDVVVHPGRLLAALRGGLDDVCVHGRVVDVGVAADRAVDQLEVQVGDDVHVVTARAVVVAAGAGNAAVLSTVAKRIVDRRRRRSAQQEARSSQGVRHGTVVLMRGATLPDLRVRVGDLTVVSHPLGDEVVWHVTRPDHDRVTLGPVELRFDPRPRPRAVADVVGSLLAAAPALVGEVDRVSWAAYGTRDAIHPALAGARADRVARPVPARLETLGLDGLFALWPSYLGQVMVLGDLVAERLADTLGASAAPGLDPSSPLPPAPVPDGRARWEADDLEWAAWDEFAMAHRLDDPNVD